MDFSFCIITDGSDVAKERIKETISSIEALNIPNYEILCIGGDSEFEDITNENFKKFKFNEKIKPIWLTKKKNDIAKLSKYDNLVIFHDYYVFDKEWYNGYLKIKEQFLSCDICSNPILLIDGQRDYVDWVTWDHPVYGKQKSINYENSTMTKYQYISGGYFVVKRNFFINNPLNEELVATQEEDVEWSLRIRDFCKIIFNKNSYVQHNKIHRHVFVKSEVVG